MPKRLILIDSPPFGGAEQLRYALEAHLNGSFNVVSTTGFKEGFEFFNQIKPALLGRSSVIMLGSWYPLSHKLKGAELQMLERAALTCGKVHLVCRPSLYRGAYEPKEVMDVLLADDHSRIEYDLNSTLHSDLPQFVNRYVLPAMDEAPTAIEPYIGNWKSRPIAIVSDKPSFKGFNVPFVSFRPDGVSWWLADGMRRAGLLEEHFVWANCADADGNNTDPGPLLALKPDKVFALGTNAAKWCQEYEVDCTVHVHPLGWKRYNTGKMYPLVSDLVKAVGALR